PRRPVWPSAGPLDPVPWLRLSTHYATESPDLTENQRFATPSEDPMRRSAPAPASAASAVSDRHPRIRRSPIATAAERRAGGRRFGAGASGASQGAWRPDARRRDPIVLLQETNAERVAELLPIKVTRMSLSPFSFYRGAAPVMARDLATMPATELRVQICGDAHVQNVGAYAAADGHLVFDLNDFDETIPGPWEWDVRRMAASLVLAG